MRERAPHRDGPAHCYNFPTTTAMGTARPIDRELDARGHNSPLPILRTRTVLNEMQSGQVLRVLATDPRSVRDVEAFARQTGNRPLQHSEEAGVFSFLVERKQRTGRPGSRPPRPPLGHRLHSERPRMATDTPAVLELTKDNFVSAIDGHPFAVVDFWAPWCGPCRSFAPTFAAAAQRHQDIRFAKVNTEDQQEIAAHFHIRSIPTLMIFRENIIVFAQAGALSAGALDQVLSAAKALDMDAVRREATAPQDQAGATSS